MSGLGLMLVVAGCVITNHNKTSLLGLAFSLAGVVVSLVELGVTLQRFAP